MKKVLIFICFLSAYSSFSQCCISGDLTGAPLSLLNMDALSSSWGGIQVVAPSQRFFTQREGNPALFQQADFQSALHYSNWGFVEHRVGEGTFDMLQHQGGKRLSPRHQVGWGFKYLIPETIASLHDQGNASYGQMDLRGNQISLNYAYMLSPHWKLGAGLHVHHWRYKAEWADVSFPFSTQDRQDISINAPATAVAFDVGLLYEKSIQLDSALSLSWQLGASITQLGPPMRWESEDVLLGDYMPTNAKVGGLLGLNYQIPASKWILFSNLGYELEKRILRVESHPANISYGQALAWGLIYAGYPPVYHKIGLDIGAAYASSFQFSLSGGVAPSYGTLGMGNIGGSVGYKGFFIASAYHIESWGQIVWNYFISDWKWSVGYRRTI